MRKASIIIIITISLNLFILSIGHSQTNVNIGAIVPETEFNRNSLKQQIKLKDHNPATGENKYLYFFEKTLGLQAEVEKKTGEPAKEIQTVHDRVSSSLLLWVLMVLAAVLAIIILKMIDRVFLRLRKSKRKI